MAVHTSCFSGISMWLHCNIASFLSLSGGHVKDHPIKLKYILFHHPDICYFVYVVHSVSSTLVKKTNLLFFRFTLPSPSFSHSLRKLSEPRLGNLQVNILEMSTLWSEKINLR